MKKKKFDMLKDLKKPTLKLVKALIEIDKFNDILKLDHHPMPVFENCVMPLSMS